MWRKKKFKKLYIKQKKEKLAYKLVPNTQISLNKKKFHLISQTQLLKVFIFCLLNYHPFETFHIGRQIHNRGWSSELHPNPTEHSPEAAETKARKAPMCLINFQFWAKHNHFTKAILRLKGGILSWSRIFKYPGNWNNNYLFKFTSGLAKSYNVSNMDFFKCRLEYLRQWCTN